MAADPDERRTRGPRSLIENGLRPSPRFFQAFPAQVQPCFITAGRQAAVEIWLLRLLVEFPAHLLPTTQAGIVKCSPRASTAQAMRAFLAAIATIARQ